MPVHISDMNIRVEDADRDGDDALDEPRPRPEISDHELDRLLNRLSERAERLRID